MKYLILSFDDGRLDTYTRAFPILKKYSMTATINAISKYCIHGSCLLGGFNSSNNKFCTMEDLIDLQNNGWEIALHGSEHNNTIENIKENISDFKYYGLNVKDIGFASPHSEIDSKNINEIYPLVENKSIKYIRSGIKVKEKNIFYIFLFLLNRYFHSKKLFRFLNKNNIIYKDKNYKILPSITIYSYTSLKELTYFIDKIKNDQMAILMFHSILKDDDKGYGEDKWYFDEKKFELLISHINNSSDVNVINTCEIFKK